MNTQGKIVVTTAMVLSLLVVDTAAAAWRDKCGSQRKAINTYAKKPLITDARQDRVIDCALEMALDRLPWGRDAPSTNAAYCQSQANAALKEGTDQFITNELEQHGNRQQVQAVLDDEATAVAANGRSIGTAIERLRQCRVGEFENIKTRYQAKRIDEKKRNKELDGLIKRIDKDNELIATVVGMTEKDVKVLQANNDNLASLDVDPDADKGPDGATYTPGGSGAMADAAQSQQALEQEKTEMQDLLRQIEEEKDPTLMDV